MLKGVLVLLAAVAAACGAIVFVPCDMTACRASRVDPPDRRTQMLQMYCHLRLFVLRLLVTAYRMLSKKADDDARKSENKTSHTIQLSIVAECKEVRIVKRTDDAGKSAELNLEEEEDIIKQQNHSVELMDCFRKGLTEKLAKQELIRSISEEFLVCKIGESKNDSREHSSVDKIAVLDTDEYVEDQRTQTVPEKCFDFESTEWVSAIIHELHEQPSREHSPSCITEECVDIMLKELRKQSNMQLNKTCNTEECIEKLVQVLRKQSTVEQAIDCNIDEYIEKLIQELRKQPTPDHSIECHRETCIDKLLEELCKHPSLEHSIDWDSAKCGNKKEESKCKQKSSTLDVNHNKEHRAQKLKHELPLKLQILEQDELLRELCKHPSVDNSINLSSECVKKVVEYQCKQKTFRSNINQEQSVRDINQDTPLKLQNLEQEDLLNELFKHSTVEHSINLNSEECGKKVVESLCKQISLGPNTDNAEENIQNIIQDSPLKPDQCKKNILKQSIDYNTEEIVESVTLLELHTQPIPDQSVDCNSMKLTQEPCNQLISGQSKRLNAECIDALIDQQRAQLISDTRMSVEKLLQKLRMQQQSLEPNEDFDNEN